jgi:hypothetical protein
MRWSFMSSASGAELVRCPCARADELQFGIGGRQCDGERHAFGDFGLPRLARHPPAPPQADAAGEQNRQQDADRRHALDGK